MPTAVEEAGYTLAFVCFFPHNISKPDIARITKLDAEMFHDESLETH